MTVATLKKVNEAIKQMGLEMFKHYDYFYFDTLEGSEYIELPESVMVRRITDLTLEQWIEHARKF